MNVCTISSSYILVSDGYQASVNMVHNLHDTWPISVHPWQLRNGTASAVMYLGPMRLVVTVAQAGMFLECTQVQGFTTQNHKLQSLRNLTFLASHSCYVTFSLQSNVLCSSDQIWKYCHNPAPPKPPTANISLAIRTTGFELPP